MSELIKLIIICVIMGFSSYAVGLIPLSFPLSPYKIRAISVLGSGILVGTALVVIIPEGVTMLYSASANHASDDLDTITSSTYPTYQDPPVRLTARHGGGGGDDGKRAEIGLALLLGFLFMYFVEKLPFLVTAFGQLVGMLPFGFGSSHSSSFIPLGNSIDMSSIRSSIFGRANNPASAAPTASPRDTSSPSGELPRHSLGSRPFAEQLYAHHHNRTQSLRNVDDENDESHASKGRSTAFGLVIHAIADGIALGASITAGDSSLEAIIFLAIMIHKAPASFGLAAVVLQAEGAAGAKRILALFASAAPAGALLSYAIIKLLGEKSTEHLAWWTGVLLLFSGGTFLYVAVHVMQELDQPDSHHSPNGLYAGPSVYNSTNTAATSGADALLGIIGMLLPLLTLLVPDE